MSSPDSSLPIEIDCSSVRLALQTAGGAFLLLDCREADEFAAARIDGAMLLPLGELPARVGELEPYRTGRIVVHCHHGRRSLKAALWLRGHGFAAQSMTGGIDEWSRDIDSTVKRY